jgi:hypothetical protein
VQRNRFRLFPEHLQRFAQLECGGDLVLLRNVCIVMVGTVGAYRKSEIMGADVCDWVEGRDYDSRRGQPLGASLNVRVQKNSLTPKSKKFAYGVNSGTCVVRKMQMYMQRADLRVQPGCQKWASPQGAGVKCQLCGPLFPSLPFGKPTAVPGIRFRVRPLPILATVWLMSRLTVNRQNDPSCGPQDDRGFSFSADASAFCRGQRGVLSLKHSEIRLSKHAHVIGFFSSSFIFLPSVNGYQ